MSASDIRAAKLGLRSQCRNARSLPEKDRRGCDAEIQSRVLTMREYVRCDTVLAYVSKDDEPDTHALIRAALANGKRVAVPRCGENDGEMDFYYINSFDELKTGKFGVLEPPRENETVLDLTRGICLVPALCFDAEGYRLGHGKGYYDRFLERFSGISVGLAHSTRVKWKLPRDEHDKPVDIIVTERYVRRVSR